MSERLYRFRRCVSPCPRFITVGDSHELCVACLGLSHATAALEGAVCDHCEALPMRVLRSRVALFSSDGQIRSPRGSGPALAEAARRVRSWGSQQDLLEGSETAEALSRPSSADSDSPGRCSASSVRGRRLERRSRSGSEEPAVLGAMEEVEDFRVSDRRHQKSAAPDYDELLDVVTRAVAKLGLDWPQAVRELNAGGRLDDRFLRSHSVPPRRSMPFFPDLHSELCRSWDKPYSARLSTPQLLEFGNVAGIKDCGYGTMPRVEDSLASYLSPQLTSSFGKPALPTGPCRVTSSLVGKAYMAAGQAGACLHTMAVLQAYQADLLLEMDERGGPSEEELAELRRAMDLSLRATKATARAVGRSMSALVATERHLWLNLSDIRQKDREFLLDAPVSTTGLFGEAVDSVVDRFRHVRSQGEAFQQFFPRRTGSRSAGSAGPSQPSTSSHRQRQSVASRGPPRVAWDAGRGVRDALAAAGPSPLCLPRGVAVGRRFGSWTTGRRRVLPGSPLQGLFRDQHVALATSPEGLVPLADFADAWRGLVNVSPWVLRTVVEGYRLQFRVRPPGFSGVVRTVVRPDQGLVLGLEVRSLLEKGAVELRSGFYSRYFLVPKKDGGLRPILDLRVLNRSLRRYRFKMLTIPAIVCPIRSEDWFVTVDLRDAYFHISIRPSHRKFLRFAFGGVAYQYRVLPFGLALSPRTFTKCMDAALAPLRLQGIRVLNYIDDWLILAQSRELAVRHRDVVLAHLLRLGLRLNEGKSVLAPAQRTVFLGVVWDSLTMLARLSPARVESLLAAVKGVRLGHAITVKHFQRVLGLMAAASSVIPSGLLHMRALQWWLKSKGFSPRGNPFRLIRVAHKCLRALSVWKKPWFLGAPCRRVIVSTDASLTGWGAVMDDRSARGVWQERHSSWHINCLEMLAVFRALRSFLPALLGHHVLVRSDNTAVVAYLNHQGGLRSRPLCRLAHQILLWSQRRLLSLRAMFIPGLQNQGADLLSRQGLRPGEWRLHPEVVESLCARFGPIDVDLFASQESTHCPLWFSLTPPAPLGLDAMVREWPRLRLYAFPPVALLPGILERVRREGICLLLVAPFWPTRVWFSDLMALLDGLPWRVPLRRDLLSQDGGRVLHPCPALWRLWVWPLRGPSTWRRA
ncbi:uncharacterized protein LOC116675969 [Etheostoma spectabile]|uniref:uncharacterized protein LOC116675969 n=1 Tax=Etheostoma spectabile TaxID=54343 RepID=UPI0013AEB131|nr:uncharacterized protein LOC116675969 [Etheostoma spectabile]